MKYMFDVELAKKYGLEEAIFLENLIFWVIRNRANQINYFDGRTWTYNSVRAFNVLFPFWTTKQMRRVLDSLLKQGVIVKGNYNKNPYDRTLWYALAEEDTFICRYGQVDLPKPPNEFCEKGQPIPDIKPDSKPDNKTDIKTTYTSKPETAAACGAYGPFKPVSLIAKDFQPVDLPEPKAEETAKVEQTPKIGLNAPETQPAVCGVQNEQKNENRPNFGENSAVVESESQTEKPKTKKLNNLQEFSNMVLERFEHIENDAQKGIWFKRNCRCLSDILNYALGDKDLACEMISCTCAFLKQNRLSGGYEAVCRQLPRWYEEALKRKREKESRQFYR